MIGTHPCHFPSPNMEDSAHVWLNIIWVLRVGVIVYFFLEYN